MTALICNVSALLYTFHRYDVLVGSSIPNWKFQWLKPVALSLPGQLLLRRCRCVELATRESLVEIFKQIRIAEREYRRQILFHIDVVSTRSYTRIQGMRFSHNSISRTDAGTCSKVRAVRTCASVRAVFYSWSNKNFTDLPFSLNASLFLFLSFVGKTKFNNSNLVRCEVNFTLWNFHFVSKVYSRNFRSWFQRLKWLLRKLLVAS